MGRHCLGLIIWPKKISKRLTMNIAQSFIDPAGEIILHRRKIKPTHVERSLWGGTCISEMIHPVSYRNGGVRRVLGAH